MFFTNCYAKSIAYEYRSNQTAADPNSGSDNAPHVVDGIGAKLSEEARLRPTLPAPPRTRNHGRVPVSFHQHHEIAEYALLNG